MTHRHNQIIDYPLRRQQCWPLFGFPWRVIYAYQTVDDQVDRKHEPQGGNSGIMGTLVWHPNGPSWSLQTTSCHRSPYSLLEVHYHLSASDLICIWSNPRDILWKPWLRQSGSRFPGSFGALGSVIFQALLVSTVASCFCQESFQAPQLYKQ